jgi:cytosine/adenosine deaminase-related metal-dependent hydrolase
MNMLQEVKAAYLAPKLQAGDPRIVSGDAVVGMAFPNNAEIVRRLWAPFGVDLRVGAVEPGCKADLAVLDYMPPTPLSAANLSSHLVFGMDGGQVRSTIVGGRWLMRDRKLLTLDEREVAASARDEAAKVWKRLKAA